MHATIILLSGPSCVGKTPLIKSFIQQNPDKKIGKPVLYTSREPRPNESDGIDYFFRSGDEIKNLDAKRFIIAQTRQMWQAIDAEAHARLVAQNDIVLYDVHPNLVKALRAHARLKEMQSHMVRVFLQPATFEEIRDVQRAMGEASMQEAAAAIMTPKLIARTQKQGNELTAKVMWDIQIRAGRAWEEILVGQDYDHIMINHDGEDSVHWRQSPPTGEAGKTLSSFAALVQKYSQK
jgi:guanylate kinase